MNESRGSLTGSTPHSRNLAVATLGGRKHDSAREVDRPTDIASLGLFVSRDTVTHYWHTDIEQLSEPVPVNWFFHQTQGGLRVMSIFVLLAYSSLINKETKGGEGDTALNKQRSDWPAVIDGAEKKKKSQDSSHHRHIPVRVGDVTIPQGRDEPMHRLARDRVAPHYAGRRKM